MLKKVSIIKDWTLPIILVVVGILFAVLILGFEGGFIGPPFLNGIMQGMLAAGMAVYVHQLTIQTTKKRIEGEEEEFPPEDAPD